MTIREKLEEFLTDKIALDEFYDWLAPIVWDVEEHPQYSKEKDLLYSIELFIAEYTSGHRSKEDLRAELKKLLE